MQERTQLLIPAAGMGVRLGAATPKALIQLDGIPLLVHTLRRFSSIGLADKCIITVPPAAKQSFEDRLKNEFFQLNYILVDGGAERQDSVLNGLAALDPNTDIVVIHDAARPFVTAESVRASIAAAAEFGAATVAVPAIDTVLVSDQDEFLNETPDRSRLWSCQTPQTFRVGVIRAAHEQARNTRIAATDDATLVRLNGGTVKLVRGTSLNFKITTPADLEMARLVLNGGLA